MGGCEIPISWELIFHVADVAVEIRLECSSLNIHRITIEHRRLPEPSYSDFILIEVCDH